MYKDYKSTLGNFTVHSVYGSIQLCCCCFGSRTGNFHNIAHVLGYQFEIQIMYG